MVSRQGARFANPLPAQVIVDFASVFIVWHIVCGKGDQTRLSSFLKSWEEGDSRGPLCREEGM